MQTEKLTITNELSKFEPNAKSLFSTLWLYLIVNLSTRTESTAKSVASTVGSADGRSDGSVMGRMKLRERLLLGLAGSVILVTLFLILDLQMDMGMTGQHLPASHGRVKFADMQDAPGAAYNSFRRKFLQKANASKESAGSQQTEAPEVGQLRTPDTEKGVKLAETEPHDDFRDLWEFVHARHKQQVPISIEPNPTLREMLSIQPRYVNFRPIACDL